MATVQIPTNFDIPFFSLTVELDSEAIDLTFFFNRRDNAWRMDVGRQGEILVRAIRLVLGVNVLDRFKYLDGMPQGTMRLVDLDQQHTEPDEDNFGDRVVLVYDEAA